LQDGEATVAPTLVGYVFEPAQTTITVQGGIVSGVNFTAFSTHSISGYTNPSLTGVTLSLSGNGVDTTAASGKGGLYSFSGLTDGTYRITPTFANHSFNPSFLDVALSGSDATGKNFTANPINPTYTISGSAGTTGVTLTLTPPGTTYSTGKGTTYSFSNLSNGTYVITPAKFGATFTPTSLEVIVNGANMPNQNFTSP
jgi:hypothetical protein